MKLASLLLVVACVAVHVTAQFGYQGGFMARRGWGGGGFRHQPFRWGSQLSYRGDDDNWQWRMGRQVGNRWGGRRINFRYGRDDWDSDRSDWTNRGRWGDDNRRWWGSDDNRRWGDDNRRWGDDNRWGSDDYGRRGWARSGNRWGQQWARPATYTTQYSFNTDSDSGLYGRSDDGRGWSRSNGWDSDDDNIFAYRSRFGGYRGMMPRGNLFNNLYYNRD